TQETAYQSLLAARRKELHCKTARAIEELFSERIAEFSTVIGEHFLRGEAWERASEYLIRAGDTAARLFALAEARLRYARALDALAHLPPTENNRRSRVDTLIMQVSVSLTADSPEQNMARMSEAMPEAMRYFSQVLAVVHKLGDPELLAVPSFYIGMALLFQGHFGKAG